MKNNQPLSTILGPIQEDLLRVSDELKSVSKVDFSWLSELLDYSLGVSGKRIRPALTLLAGMFYDYNLDYLLPMATSVELMHTATLVHDDAIDKSSVRRSRPTINKLWGEEQAVLLGDFLFAKAGEFVTATQNIQAIRLFTQTLGTISAGELNQIYNAFNLEQNRQQYLQRISNKTASLFSLATETGAILSHAPEKSVNTLREYGHNLGIAFQIVDDGLDFIGTEEDIGKPVGSDLAQGTLTLPAILLLERFPEDNPVKRLFHQEDTKENTKLAIELVRNSSIIPECYQIATDYCDRGCRYLNHLPSSPIRQVLIDLANFITQRKE